MGRGSRGRRRGRRKSKAARSSRSKASSSKSKKSKSRRRSTASSKRKSVRSKAKARRAAKRTAKASTSTSKSTSKNKTKKKRITPNLRKTLKQKIKSLGLNKKKTETKTKRKTISAAQSRRQVRQKTKDKIATRKKISLGSIARNITKGAAAHASNQNKKQQSKFQRQIANFKDRVQRLSTPEAKRERRFNRLRDQHGLDYSRMRDGLTIKANVGMALNREHKIPGTNIKIRAPKSWVKRVPQSIKNIKFNYTLKSPTKLGARDGWTRKNARYNRNSNRDLLRPMPLIDTENIPESFGKPIRGHILPVRGSQRNIDMGPKQDWLSKLYSTHNINQGKLDQGARDYWSKAAKTQGRDAVMRSIIGTSKAQGTYGGRKKPTGGRRINTGRRARPHYRGKAKRGSVDKAAANKSLNII